MMNINNLEMAFLWYCNSAPVGVTSCTIIQVDEPIARLHVLENDNTIIEALDNYLISQQTITSFYNYLISQQTITSFHNNNYLTSQQRIISFYNKQ